MKQALLFLFILATAPAFAQSAPSVTHVAPAPSSASVSEYVGTYTFESGSPLGKFTITEKADEIYGEADEHGSNKLVKQAETDTFQSTSSYGSIIVFKRDATTKVITGLILRLQGQEITATKEAK